MTCTNCHKENRSSALYCRFCGQQLLSLPEEMLNDIAGMESIKEWVGKKFSNLQKKKADGHSDSKYQEPLSLVIMGNQGSGKTMISKRLGEVMVASGLVTGKKVEYISSARYHEFAQKIDSHIKNLLGGVLIIDDVHLILPRTQQEQINPLDVLYEQMEKHRSSLTVIFCGSSDGLEPYFNHNKNRENQFFFNRIFRLPDYTPEELYTITCLLLKKEYNMTCFAPNCEPLMKDYLHYQYKKTRNNPANGHLCLEYANKIYAENDYSHTEIQPEEVDMKVPGQKSPDEILAELNMFVGMQHIKKDIGMYAHAMAGKKAATPMHLIITGNPGTGKTTLVQKLGEIFEAIGLIDVGHIVPVKKQEVVTGYKGDAAVRMRKLCEKAMGGILFIDEAYRFGSDDLMNQPDQESKEAIETLMQYMEDENTRTGFICIAAGYPEKMNNFFRINPGLRDRFKKTYHIDDYTPEELEEIFLKLIIQNGYTIEPHCEVQLRNIIERVYNNRPADFSNARKMRKLAEDAIAGQNSRIQKLSEKATFDENEQNIIKIDDILKALDMDRRKPIEEIFKEMDGMIGMEDIKKELRLWATSLEGERKRRKMQVVNNEPEPLNIVITGNPGTGKTTLANMLGEILYSMELLPSSRVKKIDTGNLVAPFVGQTVPLTNKTIDDAQGGVLFLDEAYTLTPDKSNPGFKQEALNTLMSRMLTDAGRLAFVFAGYQKEMADFIQSNPGMDGRIPYRWHIQDYTPEELYRILVKQAEKRGYTFSEAAAAKAQKKIDEMFRLKTKTFRNAGEMEILMRTISKNHHLRLARLTDEELNNPDLISTIQAEDIPYEQSKHMDTKQALKKLDELQGLKKVKDRIQEIAQRALVSRRIGENYIFDNHLLFVGNPGTGKTTVARIITQIFYDLGILSRNICIETERKDFIGSTSNDSVQKTEMQINRAMGGVLFIDEAYTICQDKNDYAGMQALGVLLKSLEDDRGKYICIMTGYKQEMRDFIALDPGLASRVEELGFEDFLPEQLEDIFRSMANEKKKIISAKADSQLRNYFTLVYNRRKKGFGNARAVRHILDQALNRQSMRVAAFLEDKNKPDDFFRTLKYMDITGKELTHSPSIEEVFAELDQFIGMDSLKKQLKDLAETVKLNQIRQQNHIGGTDTMGLNIVITGNPGTGKTTVANILGKIFKALDLLPDDTVHLMDMTKLIGQYLGQTPHILKKSCEEAMGAVMFIDEAYKLRTNGFSGDAYKEECINEIVTRMLDDKGKMSYVLAGYTREMNELLKSNAGLKSRINFTLHIDDYNARELFRILLKMISDRKMALDEDAVPAVEARINDMLAQNDPYFGNAREMENLLEQMIRLQSARLTKSDEEITPEKLQVLTREDVPSNMF